MKVQTSNGDEAKRSRLPTVLGTKARMMLRALSKARTATRPAAVMQEARAVGSGTPCPRTSLKTRKAAKSEG